MMIQQATPNVTSYFKARALNGRIDPRVTANVLSLMPLDSVVVVHGLLLAGLGSSTDGSA